MNEALELGAVNLPLARLAIHQGKEVAEGVEDYCCIIDSDKLDTGEAADTMLALEDLASQV